MKNFIIAILATFLAVSAYAEKDVTKFLGIPIDGTKAEMRQKLMAKGYKPEKVGDSEYLAGEFNGRDVYISIVTNNNKVYRILVVDQIPTSASSIKNRFNTLVRQFEKNTKYTYFGDEQTIPEDEDISYEMIVHKKNYDAGFYQYSFSELEEIVKEKFILVKEKLLGKYTKEQLENENDKAFDELSYESLIEANEVIKNKSVWFKISNDFGDYRIFIYYDNEYNKANGEDL